MKCCANCFRDPYIKQQLASFGPRRIGSCDYCSSEKIFCVDPAKISKYILPLVELYTPINEAPRARDSHKYIWDHLKDDFGLFSDETKSKSLTKSILVGDIDPGDEIFSKKVVIQSGGIKELYKDRIDLWQSLCQEMKFENRFFFKKPFNFNVLRRLMENMAVAIPVGQKLFRTRISPDKKCFENTEMGCPPVSMTSSGRANPPGISYLYLASMEDVAIYEVKPSIMDCICVGEFIAGGGLRCVDFRFISPFQFFNAEDYEMAVKYVGMFTQMGEDLKISINHRTAHYEYVPTQYICEMIKSFGFSGVIYNSSMGEGFNLTLFDPRDARCVAVKPKIISKIKYS